MSASSARVFVDLPAVRSAVPLFVGIVGPSGSGKTYSALRLASGMQKVCGGDVYGIDSEANRMLHYADKFKFRHVPFTAPFGPLDYLAAVDHCVKKGAKTIIIDSASHLHEGPGGTLEAHEEECTRLSEAWKQPREKVQMAAWQKPKSELRRFLNSVLQMQANLIFCFRAKEKLKVIPGRQPERLGFMPIAGDEMIYEMTLNVLLYPNCGGVPEWDSREIGEKSIIKLPGQFRDIFSTRAPLSEDIGGKLATWAAGGAAPSKPANDVPSEKPWLPRLRKALGGLKLGAAEAEQKGLKGDDRKAFLLGKSLMYCGWAAGRDINAIDELTDEEADVVCRRAELGEMP